MPLLLSVGVSYTENAESWMFEIRKTLKSRCNFTYWLQDIAFENWTRNCVMKPCRASLDRFAMLIMKKLNLKPSRLAKNLNFGGWFSDKWAQTCWAQISPDFGVLLYYQIELQSTSENGKCSVCSVKKA